ncbi:MAG: hypothetical protein IKR83_06220, partial [Bacteroidales bacterium]|nr:hypothetical protein [Bacteroidales bacterium]
SGQQPDNKRTTSGQQPVLTAARQVVLSGKAFSRSGILRPYVSIQIEKQSREQRCHSDVFGGERRV